MALNLNVAWEVRTSSSGDTQGGGFVAGATGTDYSQQDAAQYTGTDLVVDATTNTKVTSASHNFVAADVGNILQVSAGASWTTGFYQIVSVAANAATLDRSPAAVGVTGGTYAVGGALLTIAKAAGACVTSNRIFVKAGTGYTSTATTTFSVGANPSVAVPHSRLIGYTTTRGDGGRASLTLSTNTGLTALSVTGIGWIIENFTIDCASLGTSIGITFSGAFGMVRNCKVSNFTARGINAAAVGTVISENEVTAGTSAALGALYMNSSAGLATQNNIHDNVCVGINVPGTGNCVLYNRIVSNTGATSDGVQFSFETAIIGNTVHANGRHGLSGSQNILGAYLIRNNILTNNGGYGLQLAAAAGAPAMPFWDGNAYYNNTSGARHFADDTTTNPINNVAPYTNTLDITLTGLPYTNAGTGDFTLNNVAGQGAAIRGHGAFPSVPGASQVSYGDMGYLQHQDPVGGGMLVAGGMLGGMRG